MRKLNEIFAILLISVNATIGLILITLLGLPITAITAFFHKKLFVFWLIDRFEKNEIWIVDKLGPVDFD